MRKLEKIGFYKELRYGDNEGPSIDKKFWGLHKDRKATIVAYLRQGVLFVLSPGISRDYFDSTRIIGSGPNILTDGIYAWPSDLSYYVENYDCAVPEFFLEHIKNKGRQIRQEEINVEILEL